jgi:hypothetical protein
LLNSTLQFVPRQAAFFPEDHGPQRIGVIFLEGNQLLIPDNSTT